MVCTLDEDKQGIKCFILSITFLSCWVIMEQPYSNRCTIPTVKTDVFEALDHEEVASIFVEAMQGANFNSVSGDASYKSDD